LDFLDFEKISLNLDLDFFIFRLLRETTLHCSHMYFEGGGFEEILDEWYNDNKVPGNDNL
jgi:hypothetical protein